ncbi:hypothetical protein BDA96_07G197000 [Sorghum bicolor]|uniref:Uncharacterized protein n=1 Tax=Sorghum bicolor TaxID=4558 RepID=A0A921U9Z2_SORBI|nr:hypothetical protein BDA96_07G197000 [Sorghum bicolor]
MAGCWRPPRALDETLGRQNVQMIWLSSPFYQQWIHLVLTTSFLGYRLPGSQRHDIRNFSCFHWPNSTMALSGFMCLTKLIRFPALKSQFSVLRATVFLLSSHPFTTGLNRWKHADKEQRKRLHRMAMRFCIGFVSGRTKWSVDNLFRSLISSSSSLQFQFDPPKAGVPMHHIFDHKCSGYRMGGVVRVLASRSF